jgi:hypothetical protein
VQCRENGSLRGPDSVSSHLRVKRLRHDPRHTAQIEAHAVFEQGEIEFFWHYVYMHIARQLLSSDFRFPIDPRRSIRGTDIPTDPAGEPVFARFVDGTQNRHGGE